MEPPTTKLAIGDVCKIVNKPAYNGKIVTIVSLPNAYNGHAYGVVGQGIPGELPFRGSELALIRKKQESK